MRGQDLDDNRANMRKNHSQARICELKSRVFYMICLEFIVNWSYEVSNMF